jgi:hypothetical protein
VWSRRPFQWAASTLPRSGPTWPISATNTVRYQLTASKSLVVHNVVWRTLHHPLFTTLTSPLLITLCSPWIPLAGWSRDYSWCLDRGLCMRPQMILVAASSVEATLLRVGYIVWWVQLETHRDPHGICRFVNFTNLRKERLRWIIIDHRRRSQSEI